MPLIGIGICNLTHMTHDILRAERMKLEIAAGPPLESWGFYGQ